MKKITVTVLVFVFLALTLLTASATAFPGKHCEQANTDRAHHCATPTPFPTAAYCDPNLHWYCAVGTHVPTPLPTKPWPSDCGLNRTCPTRTATP